MYLNVACFALMHRNLEVAFTVHAILAFLAALLSCLSSAALPTRVEPFFMV